MILFFWNGKRCISYIYIYISSNKREDIQWSLVQDLFYPPKYDKYIWYSNQNTSS
jgi:hypothetical protein